MGNHVARLEITHELDSDLDVKAAVVLNVTTEASQAQSQQQRGLDFSLHVTHDRQSSIKGARADPLEKCHKPRNNTEATRATILMSVRFETRIQAKLCVFLLRSLPLRPSVKSRSRPLRRLWPTSELERCGRWLPRNSKSPVRAYNKLVRARAARLSERRGKSRCSRSRGS